MIVSRLGLGVRGGFDRIDQHHVDVRYKFSPLGNPHQRPRVEKFLLSIKETEAKFSAVRNHSKDNSLVGSVLSCFVHSSHIHQ